MSFLTNPIIRPIVDFLLKDNEAHNESKRKLNIELVPFTMHYKNVRAVLATEVWYKVCDIAHAKHDYRCCECGRNRREVKLECHETWEFIWEKREVSPGYFKKVAIMKMTNLLSLCHLCHMGKHIKFAERNGELPQVREHLMKTYNISRLQFWWKVQKSVAVVRKQSRYTYQLDLTYLNHDRFNAVHAIIGRKFSSNEIHNCRKTTQE